MKILGIGVDMIENARIKKSLKHAKKPLLIGGGYIGLELAASMQEMGLSVSIIELEDRLLKRVTAPVMSNFYKNLHESRGVKIFCNQKIESINISKYNFHDDP